MLIAIPTGVKIFNWLGTVWGGVGAAHDADAVRARASSRCSRIGGLSGVMHSIVPADTQQTDTYFVVAHFHYVLFGGLMFAIFGGFYYWCPKIFGRMLDERLGKIELLADAHRVQPHVLPDALPRPRRACRAAPTATTTGMGWDALNQLATVGAFIIALVGARLPRQRRSSRTQPRRGRPATTRGTAARSSGRSRRRRPSTTSPRSPRSTPATTSGTASTPRTTRAGCVPLPSGGADDDADGTTPTHDGHGIHLPSPSYYPLVVAARAADPRLRARCSRTRGSLILGAARAALRHLRLGASSRPTERGRPT